MLKELYFYSASLLLNGQIHTHIRERGGERERRKDKEKSNSGLIK